MFKLIPFNNHYLGLFGASRHTRYTVERSDTVTTEIYNGDYQLEKQSTLFLVSSAISFDESKLFRKQRHKLSYIAVKDELSIRSLSKEFLFYSPVFVSLWGGYSQVVACFPEDQDLSYKHHIVYIFVGIKLDSSSWTNGRRFGEIFDKSFLFHSLSGKSSQLFYFYY